MVKKRAYVPFPGVLSANGHQKYSTRNEYTQSTQRLMLHIAIQASPCGQNSVPLRGTQQAPVPTYTHRKNKKKHTGPICHLLHIYADSHTAEGTFVGELRPPLTARCREAILRLPRVPDPSLPPPPPPPPHPVLSSLEMTARLVFGPGQPQSRPTLVKTPGRREAGRRSAGSRTEIKPCAKKTDGWAVRKLRRN